MYDLLIAQQNAFRNLYSEVRHLSIKDPLTLVNNRRGFFEIVNSHLETARRLGIKYAVLMIDIDNFKNINDRYGHLVGDEVIKSVAQRISALVREGNAVGRFGGEEFVVFLMDHTKEAAFDFAENLRQDLAGYFHIVSSFRIRITVSIGVSGSEGASHVFDRILTEADQALYAAKNNGRNKTTIWEESAAPPQSGYKNFRTTVSTPATHAENISTQVLRGLLQMLYLRDYETEAHTIRVSEMTLKLAQKLEFTGEQLERVQVGALLHDIGKIGVPDRILFKQGGLTDAEWAVMKRHPQYAYDLISSISFFQGAVDIPYCHHEYWNGQGYPRGLREEEIPLAARIFSIVDVWDALSSDRPYRAAWQTGEIRNFLREKSGAMFDPALVPLFLEALDQSP
jgi:diguanylate cyclase (GGDEF)-like protein/putative nucleotidyltransferase with HDIG domain